MTHFVLLTPDKNQGPIMTTMNRILYHDLPPRRLDIPRHSVPSKKYLPQRPRMVGVYFTTAMSDSYIGTERIPVNTYRLHKTYTTIHVSLAALESQEHLYDSRDYKRGLVDPLETETCKVQYDWQRSYYPSCNHVMEQDLTQLELDSSGEPYVKLLANGYWRDVWKLQSGTEKMVLKTLRYEHDFKPRNYDRHRRDAVAMEQLTSSTWVMGIYGFCGNSGIFEFADGGSLEDSLFADDTTQEKWSPSEKLVVAYQVASGLAAVHDHPKEGVAAIAHTDITPGQYVYVGSAGAYKLNDFNRCRFISWDSEKNEACPFEVGNNPGIFRSPEEYAYKAETEKVDVYSMGNIFYSILTGLLPFEEEKDTKKVPSLVKGGGRPPISSNVLNSTDPFDQVLLNATYRCWVQDPMERASAREIQRYLEGTLLRLGIQKS
jgi:serine/threonine protein kinase